MNEPDILQHLLGVEAEAENLVDNAQAEADKRVAEGEKQNLAHYDERYGQRLAELEAAYESELTRIKEEHQKQHELYRKSLAGMPLHIETFSELVDRLLLREG